jgi:hypothetical protein
VWRTILINRLKVSWSDIPGWITFLSILPVLLVVVYLLVAWAIVDSPWTDKL